MSLQLISNGSSVAANFGIWIANLAPPSALAGLRKKAAPLYKAVIVFGPLNFRFGSKADIHDR
ncbi:hypothetical protein EGT31_01045 [Bordetella bronchiseptica]|uniref:hypothetical protein n=1 Tax=Bordetella bronchiseptica TaxID=518 RepID=UPI00059ADB6C|nr:hypothetical protein [Bordetella bronchiseptica]RSB96847.1 hypothetical protein EGT31_01045 [Bordetella bronchiseptica]RSC05900.1 hypothetical protein EGT23_03895 [Bordetella bronchiseptica]